MNKHLTAKQYTLHKIVFDTQGDIIKHIDIGLEPMSLVEAHTMKGKQIYPHHWQVVRVV